MAWVRLDDDFTDNAKIAGLSDRDFRGWIRLLCYCGRAKGSYRRRQDAKRGGRFDSLARFSLRFRRIIGRISAKSWRI